MQAGKDYKLRGGILALSLLVCSLILGGVLFFSQQPGPAPAPLITALEVQTIYAPLAPVPNGSGFIIGNAGPATLFYWIVATYPTGNATPTRIEVDFAPNTLTASNKVRVNWTAATGALTYDVLKTTTPTLPNGTATIALSTAQVATTLDDTGGALAPYTIATLPPNGIGFDVLPNLVAVNAAPTPPVSLPNQGRIYYDAAAPCFKESLSGAGYVCIGTGAGSVTNFSAGNFSPVFTTTVSNPGTTPNLTFTAISQLANLFYASPNGAPGIPTFRAIVTADLPPGTGTVTNLTVGNLSPLFTSSVANATTTPAVTFAQISQLQNLVFASPNGAPGLPTFRALVVADLPPTTLSCGGLTTNALLKWNGTTCVSSTVIDDGTNFVQSPNGLTVDVQGVGDQRTVGGTGVTAGLVACTITGSGAVQDCPTSATTGIAGVSLTTVAAGGTVRVCFTGNCYPTYDGATTPGDWAINSTTVIGELHDTGSTVETVGNQNVYVLATNGGAGTIAKTQIFSPDSVAGTTGGRAQILQVNGATLTKPIVNFNSTTPAAGAGQINILVSTSNAANVSRVSYQLPFSAPLAVSGGNLTCPTCNTSSASVTSFSAGNLSPLFTTSVANATTTPALTFTLSNAAAGTVFGNPTGASAAPIYTPTPLLGVAGGTTGLLGFSGTTSGTVNLTVAAVAGSWTLTLPTTGGTSGFFLQTNGSGVTTWANLSTGVRTKTCVIDNDTQSATALVAAQFSGRCVVPAASTITEIDVIGGTGVLTGTPAAPTVTGTGSIQVGKYTPSTAASVTGLISAQLATASGQACALPTAGAATCPIFGITQAGAGLSITTTALAAGDMLYVSAATPDAAQTWYSVAIHFTVN